MSMPVLMFMSKAYKSVKRCLYVRMCAYVYAKRAAAERKTLTLKDLQDDVINPD